MNNRFFRIILRFILFVILIFSGITVFPAMDQAADTTHMFVRQPGPEFIEAFRSQPEFNYASPPLETNFMQRLWGYLQQHLGNWDEFLEAIPVVFKVLFWGLVIFLLFIVISTIRLYRLFYSDQEIIAPVVVSPGVDDQLIDYDEAIRLEVEQKQYRRAIRLLYLKVIHVLRLRDYIHFSKEKTNVDFMLDLSGEDLKSKFHAITSVYNHVWYGELEIAEDQYRRFETNFQSFYTTISIEK